MSDEHPISKFWAKCQTFFESKTIHKGAVHPVVVEIQPCLPVLPKVFACVSIRHLTQLDYDPSWLQHILKRVPSHENTVHISMLCGGHLTGGEDYQIALVEETNIRLTNRGVEWRVRRIDLMSFKTATVEYKWSKVGEKNIASHRFMYWTLSRLSITDL